MTSSLPSLVTPADLDRLAQAGRAKGHLDTQDLMAALPIASLDPEEIAQIVVRLEDMGVPVELDESLIMSRASTPPGGPVPPLVLPGEPAPPSPKTGSAGGEASGGLVAPADPAAPPPRGALHIAVLGGAVLAGIVVIVLILAL